MKKQAVTALILFLAVIVILINSPFQQILPGCKLKIIDRNYSITLPLTGSHNGYEIEFIINKPQ